MLTSRELAGKIFFFFFFSLHFTRWRCSHSLKTHPAWMIALFPMPSLSHTSDFKLHVYFNSCVGYPRVKLGHLFCIRLLNCESVRKRFTSRLSANEIHASLKEPIRLSCYPVASPSSFDRPFWGGTFCVSCGRWAIWHFESLRPASAVLCSRSVGWLKRLVLRVAALFSLQVTVI